VVRTASKPCRQKKANRGLAQRNARVRSHAVRLLRSKRTRPPRKRGTDGAGGSSKSGTPGLPLLGGTLPEVVSPIPAPPVEEHPTEVPPVEKGPVEKRPVKTPPVEEPPAEKPPAEKPPAEKPPADEPPAEKPPVEEPPAEEPPAEKPPVEEPPAEEPPAEEPPVEEPPAEEPPVEEPPAEEPPVEEPPVEEPPAPFRYFASTSFWNEPLLASTPLDPSSAAIVGAFNQVVAIEGPKKGLNINTTAYSVPIYTVPANQPTVKVIVNKPNSSGYPLQAAWSAVPLPPNAQPAKGTDKTLAVWQPSTDKLWEFWNFERTLTGSMARWGGAMEKVSQGPGVYTSLSWPGAKPQWGSSASSLAIVGGLITLEDLEKGRINHALAMAVPNPRAVVYASPAQRTDGTSTEPFSLPEGAHLRLDPNLNLASLHLPHLMLMMAEAAQRYGIFVRDRSANITFYAQDPTPTGTNPYIGPHGYFEGKCQCQLLTAFPWSHLQLLKMELH
jgi:hypothetical protein